MLCAIVMSSCLYLFCILRQNVLMLTFNKQKSVNSCGSNHDHKWTNNSTQKHDILDGGNIFLKLFNSKEECSVMNCVCVGLCHVAVAYVLK